MVEKPSEPVWSIFTKEGAGLQEYDIFPKLDLPEGGKRANTTNLAPGVKLESLVVETDKKPRRLERKGIILNPSARGDPSLVKSKDRTSSRPTGSFKVKEEDLSPKSREKVQQSGSEKDCTSTRAAGRFMVKEENVSSGLREIVQLGGGEKDHPTPLERFLKEFRPSTSTSTFEEPGEAAAAALKYFEWKRLESGRKSNFPVLDYQSTLKKYYPEFFNNAEHGIVGHVPGVEVGLTLRYRDELRLLGIHREKQKGIDSKDVKSKDDWNYERVALSVVLSGVYEDCDDHGEVLMYVGEGGRDPKSNQQVKDQSKNRLGNQALMNNCHHKIPVRVIRKRMNARSPSKRLFSYDGLYKVADWEHIRGMAGRMVFRFKLVREPNQNALVWRKREPKPFVGRATRQDAIAQRETKPFVDQIAGIEGKNPAVGQAARRGATASGEMEPSGRSVGRAASSEVTASGEMEPSGRSVGRAASSEVTGRGESALNELVTKGKQVSTSIKEDQLNLIDLSDEESVSSDSDDSSNNSVVELSDDESVSLDESDEYSGGGSVEWSDDMASEDSEEKPARVPNEEDDFNIVNGEEGGDCIVHEEPDQGRKVSPGCVEMGVNIVNGEEGGDCVVQVEEKSAVEAIPQHVEEESIAQAIPQEVGEGVNIVNGEEGGDCIVKVEGESAVEAIPQHVEEESVAQAIPEDVGEEALNNGLDRNTSQASKLHGEIYVEKLEVGIEDGRKIDAVDDINTSAESDDTEGDGEYEVEEIMDKQIIGKPRRTKYLVRWKGYAENDDTWEPLSNLKNCRRLVENFNSRKKRRLHRRG